MGRVQREWCPGVHPLHRETRNLAGEPQEQKKARERLVALLRFGGSWLARCVLHKRLNGRHGRARRCETTCGVCQCICLDVCVRVSVRDEGPFSDFVDGRPAERPPALLLA